VTRMTDLAAYFNTEVYDLALAMLGIASVMALLAYAKGKI